MKLRKRKSLLSMEAKTLLAKIRRIARTVPDGIVSYQRKDRGALRELIIAGKVTIDPDDQTVWLRSPGRKSLTKRRNRAPLRNH